MVADPPKKVSGNSGRKGGVARKRPGKTRPLGFPQHEAKRSLGLPLCSLGLAATAETYPKQTEASEREGGGLGNNGRTAQIGRAG